MPTMNGVSFLLADSIRSLVVLLDPVVLMEKSSDIVKIQSVLPLRLPFLLTIVNLASLIYLPIHYLITGYRKE